MGSLFRERRAGGRLGPILAAVLLVAGLAPPAVASADPAAGYQATWAVTRPDGSVRSDDAIAVGDDLSVAYSAVDGTAIDWCVIAVSARGGWLMQSPGTVVDGECRLTVRLPDFPNPAAREGREPDDPALDLCVAALLLQFEDLATRSLRAGDVRRPAGRACNHGANGPDNALDFRIDPTGARRPFASEPLMVSWNPADWGTSMAPLEFGTTWQYELPSWVVRCRPYLNGEWGTVIQPAPGETCQPWAVRIPGVLPSTLPWGGDGGETWGVDIVTDYSPNVDGLGSHTQTSLRVPLAPSDTLFTSSLPAIFPVDLATARFVNAGDRWQPVFQVTGAQPAACTLELYTVPPTFPTDPVTSVRHPGTPDADGRCAFDIDPMTVDEFHQYFVGVELADGTVVPNFSFGGDVMVIPPTEPPVIDPPTEEPGGETGIDVEPGDGQGLAVDLAVAPATTTATAGVTITAPAAEDPVCTDRAVSPNLEVGGSVPPIDARCSLAPGSYVATARMVDAAGSVVTSSRSFTVLGPRPTVTGRTPAANATNVPRDVRPTVTFDMPVTGISSSTVRLGDISVGGFASTTVTWDAALRRVTVRPSALLAAGHTYRLYLTSGIKSAAGRSIAYQYWNFKVTSDATRPTYTRTPGSGATGVSRTTNVLLNFSEPVRGVTGTRIRLKDTVTGLFVPAVVTYNATLRRATLNPDVTLRSRRRYQVVVSSGISDLAGNPLASGSWTFTTRS